MPFWCILWLDRVFYFSSCSCRLFFSFVHFYLVSVVFYFFIFYWFTLHRYLFDYLQFVSGCVALWIGRTFLFFFFHFLGFWCCEKRNCLRVANDDMAIVSSNQREQNISHSDLNRSRLTFRSNHSASVSFSHTNFTLPIDFSFNDLVLVYIDAILILLRDGLGHTKARTWQKGTPSTSTRRVNQKYRKY